MSKALEGLLVLLVLSVFVIVVSGCAHRPPKIVTEEVKVPVPVDCIDRNDVPPERNLETDRLTPSASDFAKIKAVLIDFKQLRGDDREMRALIRGCLLD